MKAFLLVTLQNAFLLTFLTMINDFTHWGIAPTIIVGIFWFVGFPMCVVEINDHKEKAKNDEDSSTS